MNISENKNLINYLLHSVIVDKKGMLLEATPNNEFIFTSQSTACAFYDDETNPKFFNQYTHRLLLQSLLDNEKSKFLFDGVNDYCLLERVSFNSFNQFLSAVEGDFDVIFEIKNQYFHFANKGQISSIIDCKILHEVDYVNKKVDLSYHISDFEKLCIENYINVFKIVKY